MRCLLFIPFFFVCFAFLNLKCIDNTFVFSCVRFSFFVCDCVVFNCPPQSRWVPPPLVYQNALLVNMQIILLTWYI